MKRIKFFGAIVLTAMFIMQFSASDISAQGVGINVAGASPDSSAMLDVSSTNKGMLIPQVVLQSASDASTIPSPATSLLVYNSGTGGLSPAGYYYNSGTPAAPVWTKFVTGSSASGWSIAGNAATDSTINFIGTTDARALVVETNGAERMRINKAGIGIGTATPQSTLDVNGSLATRTTTASINSNSLITVGNSSHINLISTGASPSAPWVFTLSNGQPGQDLILQLQSGYVALQNTGNVKLTSTPYATFLFPYSVLYLKWDNTNAAWIELSRNGFLASPQNYNATKAVFTYTGANQSFIVPPYVNQVFVKMWGAAGGSSNVGGVYAGSGAFVSGYLTVTPGSTLTVIVGGGGQTGTYPPTAIPGGFGGGGAAQGNNYTTSIWYTGSGGGRSAIQITPGTDAATVGGGGGSGGHFQSTAPTGGGGGATTGQNGGTGVSGSTGAIGKGGTISVGGAGGNNGTDGGVAIGGAGSSQTGGAGGQNTYTGGGGGGGYFGGGGGAGAGALTRADGGGGGGSSYTSNLTTVTNTAGSSSSGGTAPNTGDVDYIAGVGMNATIGGGGPGGNGLVVIYY